MARVARASPLCPWTSTGLQSRRRTLSCTQFINWWRKDRSLPRRSVLTVLLMSWSGWTTGQDCSFMMTFSTGGVLIPMEWNRSSCCALSSFALSCASYSTMTWDTWGRTGPLLFAKISSSGLEWAMMWSSGLPNVSDVSVPRLHHYLSVLCWRLSSPVNQWIALDFLTLEDGGGGATNVLVMTDHFTKFAMAVPTTKQTAMTTARVFFDSFIIHYAFPSRIHSDQGRNFESRIIKELCTIAGVKKTRTTPYYPMGKGCTELFNRTLISMLRTLEEGQKRNWKRFMPQLVHAYNCTRHSTTGASPYYLLFGRQPRLAADVLLNLHTPGSGARCQTEYIKDLQKRLKMMYRVAQYAMKKAASRAKKHYDLRVRGSVPEVGDLVLVKLVGLTGKHKLADKWKSELYKIIRKPDAGIPVYVVQRCNGSGAERTLHRNMLFPLALPLHSDETQDKDGAVAVDDSLSSDLASVSDDVPRVRTQSQPELDISSSKSYDSPISLQDGLVPLVASEVDNDVPAGSGDSGAGQDTSLNVPQEIEVAVTPEEERSSEEEESLSSEEESQPLRRSTKNRRPSGQYHDGTYLMYPQIAMTAQWKAEFDVLWSRFPEKRMDIYRRLLNQISDHWWMNCRGRQFCWGDVCYNQDY